jgi:pyruvate/2-oxoglutarate dehydrogenase complex dihydrolipoamide dehydrogenase (E3) component
MSSMEELAPSPRNESPEEYDLVVIGSGEGSKYLAWTMAKRGQRVAVIEKKYIGGSCPNIACLPSKNAVHSAKVASYFRRGEEFGMRFDGFTVDMAAVRERKRKMVASLVDIHVNNFKTSGAELIMGTARFVAPRTVEVALNDGGVRRLIGTNVLIGTGTHATLDPIPGLAESQPLTHIEALELDRVPDHLLVLGGGYIGLEFAQAMRRFGSRVTVIDRNKRLVHREDEDVAQALQSLFHDEGIDLLLNTSVERVAGLSGESVEVTVKVDEVKRKLTGSHLLVATGRTPNTAGLGLESAGVELAPNGYIKVNERLQTTAPGVWANGEIAGSPQFTHIAFDDFRIVRDNLAGIDRVTTGRQVPFTLFTDPEFAHIGLSEKQAAEQGIAYRLFKVPMAADLRTRTLSETRGFLKALVDTGSDHILGFSVFGVDGGEIMGAMQIAMIGNLPYTALRDAIITHPTLMEGLIVLFSSAPVTIDPTAAKS